MENNVLCDGQWNEAKQEIAFDMDEKLIAVNKYYLILSYRPSLKSVIKEGDFIPTEHKVASIE